MIITAWVLLIMFGFILLMNTRKYLLSSLNKLEVALYVISIIIVAVAAGVIWGGLFSYMIPVMN